MSCELLCESERVSLYYDALGRAGAVDPCRREWGITRLHLSRPPSVHDDLATPRESNMLASAGLPILRHQVIWDDRALSFVKSESHLYPPPHSLTSNVFGSIVSTFVSVILVTFQSLTGCLNNFFLVLLQSLTGCPNSFFSRTLSVASGVFAL